MTGKIILILGAVYISVLTIIFRSFFILSQQPLFQLPLLGVVLGIEFIFGLLLFKKINTSFNKRKIYSFFLTIILIYLPLLSILLKDGKTILGLSFSSSLTGFALSIYPMVILFPLAFSLGVFSRQLFSEKINMVSFMAGSILYLLADYAFIWHLDLICAALISSALCSVVLAVTAYETVPKVKYWSLLTIIMLVIFSSIPGNITQYFQSFSKNHQLELIATEKTSYGEAFLHKKSDQYRFSINHSRIFKYPDTRNIQENIHSTLLQFPWAESVLVIGEWKEVIDEIARYPDIRNIYWAQPVPGAYAGISNAMPSKPETYDKLRIIKKSDPRIFIRNLKDNNFFDIVLVSLPDPTNIFFNRFYTLEFFRELKALLSDYSMISITLKTGEEDLGDNDKILSATVYRTLKRVFPNTLEIYGNPSNILASNNRGFSTSHLALSEFLNTLNNSPEYVSPAVLKYKMDTRDTVREQLDIDGESINMDTKPASLKYSFNQLVLTLGILPNFFINLTDNINPLAVYAAILILTISLILFSSRKEFHEKLIFAVVISTFLLTSFSYDIIILFQTAYGQVFKLISVFLLFLILGIVLSMIYLRNKEEGGYDFLLKLFFTISGLFLLIIPTVFETRLQLSPIIYLLLFSVIGGFLFGGSVVLEVKTYYGLNPSPARKRIHLPVYMVIGFVFACISAIFIVPVVGTIELLPALGIMSTGLVFMLST